MLLDLEKERYNRKIAELNLQYDAVKTHLDEISRATSDHFDRMTALSTPIQAPRPAPPPKPATKKEKVRKKRG